MSPTQTTRRPWKSTFWSRWTNSLPLPYTSVPHAHIYIRKLFPKKAFTRSQEVRFPMVFIRKRCEGFHFQPFTRFTGHGVARGQCEGLEGSVKAWNPQPFTIGSNENQQETNSLWTGEQFFRDKLRIYTRVKERNNETFTDTVKQIPWHPHSLNHILTPESCTDAAVQEPHSGRIHGSVTLHEQVQDYFSLLGD